MRVLNAAQMREADRRTIEDIGIPSLVLMENAGRQVVAAMEAIYTVITDVNASSIPVVSVDIPSGLSADSCDPIGESIEAGTTVTLAAPKLPLVLPPAETRAGDIVIADIGIPGDVLDSVEGPRI